MNIAFFLKYTVLFESLKKDALGITQLYLRQLSLGGSVTSC